VWVFATVFGPLAVPEFQVQKPSGQVYILVGPPGSNLEAFKQRAEATQSTFGASEG